MPVKRHSSPAASRASWLAGFGLSLLLIVALCAVASPASGLTVIIAPTIDTEITSGPADGSATEVDRPTFAFTATRDGEPFSDATFNCSLDNAPSQPCTSPIMVGPLEDGSHTFTVYAEDAARFAADPEPASRTFTVFEEEPECEEFEDEEGFVEEECDEEEEVTDLPPEECMLRTARARLFTFADQDKVRLVIRYTSFAPADVTVNYRLSGSRGALRLDAVRQRFAKQGMVRITERLTEAQSEKVRAAKRFTVMLEIPGTPRYCNRYDTRHLTIKKSVHSQVVWFQSDSVFGTKP